jgi:hypothetical protein
MGREIKRVPLDFSWPIDKVWQGFINPFSVHSHNCPTCQGTGNSPEVQRLHEQWYGTIYPNSGFVPADPFPSDHPIIMEKARRNSPPNDFALRREAQRLADHFNAGWCHHLDADDVAALIAADRLWDFTRNPRTPEQAEICKKKVADGGNSWLPKSNGYVPTPKEVNEWSISGFGHDSINCWVCVKAKAKRLGYRLTCKTCKGRGCYWDSPELKKKYDHWKSYEPPTGDGWQVWETVSEGSPISPVFASSQELEKWLVGQGYSAEAAHGFSKTGWTMSMMQVGGKFYKDIEACAVQK